MTGTVLSGVSGASAPLTVTDSPGVQEAADLALCLQLPAKSDAVLQGKKQVLPRGGNQLLVGGLVTNHSELTVPFMTSHRIDYALSEKWSQQAGVC